MRRNVIHSLHNKGRQVVEYQRYSRHIHALLRHATSQKIRNLITVEFEYRKRSVLLRGRPYKVIIDPCNVCFLGCRLCPSGMNELRRSKRMMDLKTFRAVVDVVEPYCIEVSLHNWGEPLLNPDICEMISYAQASDIATNMSTTLATADYRTIDEIIEAGLEYLVVSLHGTCSETYNAYVPKGDFSKVLDNLETLIRRRSELGSKHPIIEWQFLVMRHNEHEILRAREMAREMGVDLLRMASAGLPFERYDDRALAEEWMTTNTKYWRLNPLKLSNQQYLLDQSCFYLYRSITVNPDGMVSPCCGLYDERYDFGDLLSDGLDRLWNNERYQSARASFAGIQREGRDQGGACNTCRIFRHPEASDR